jgi:hypothetical protein
MLEGLPTVDNRNLAPSLSKLAQRICSILDVNVNVKRYEKIAVELVKAFDKDFMKWSKFNALTEEEQVIFKTLILMNQSEE